MKKNNFIIELFCFILEKKAYWILPLIIFLVLMSFVIIASTAPYTAFIYSIF